ncbi:MAG: SHOCT domain-containing protein [Clostridia bacterium]|nr:SHOCT domain-containing protein [Clostridia bacterium]
MEEKIVMQISTALAELKVYEDHCVLTAKKNAVSLLITNKFFAGDKKFYYSDLTSVQFRDPGLITDGYMEFEYPGSRSGNSSGAYTSENAIAFTKKDLEKMKEIYNYVDGKIREYKNKGNETVQQLSPADELKKFKELLDAGIITQDEFDAKKKELLGL